MIKFEANKTYQFRSICDADCVQKIMIVSRTAKTVVAHIDGKQKAYRVKELDGAEAIMPWGSYSMAPILRASSEVK